MALDPVARAPGLLAPRHELVEQRASGCRARGGRRRRSGPRSGPPSAPGLAPDQVQRVDLERADEARVEALEVEHDHVAVKARGAARARGRPPAAPPSRRPRATLGATTRRRPQLGEVEEVEGRDGPEPRDRAAGR